MTLLHCRLVGQARRGDALFDAADNGIVSAALATLPGYKKIALMVITPPYEAGDGKGNSDVEIAYGGRDFRISEQGTYGEKRTC